MPDNLIAFACNAIESSLADIATGVHQFTNKVYAPKWVNLTSLLGTMKTMAPDAHKALKKFLADNVLRIVAAQVAGQDPQSQEAAPGDGEGDFLSWQEIEVTTSVPVDDSAAERPVSQGVSQVLRAPEVDGPRAGPSSTGAPSVPTNASPSSPTSPAGGRHNV
ncbi:hypothetical protein FOMPIDRAFT_1047762 [Fomitopsis schrenkii]|uniref:Uncharacterized protein n=1 Tax=Fomitopsis schrenkii TaxID=2126942 RepID=S8EBQ9_FOMSC|nr:hypothetical protein FOMPIDRAFT_1047762 [Fomitopsis schrenkii]